MADIAEKKLRPRNVKFSKFLESAKQGNLAAEEAKEINFSFYEERSRKGLRILLVLVSIFTLSSGVQSLKTNGKFLKEKIYTTHQDQVNPLMSRMFGITMFFFAIVRFHCAVDINNNLLLPVTAWSFVFQMLHLLSEMLIYRSAALRFDNFVFAALLVSVVSLVWLIIHSVTFKSYSQ